MEAGYRRAVATSGASAERGSILRMFKDDPDFDEVLADIEAYRRERDAEMEEYYRQLDAKEEAR